jgi:predicted metal-dependent hydrolase
VQDAARQLPLFTAEHEEPGPKPGFSVRQSHRAKRLSIKVYPRGRVEVVVPRRTSARAVKAFVEENRDWIDRARDSFAAHYPAEAFALPKTIDLATLDEQFEVRYVPEASATRVRYRQKKNELILSGKTGDEQQCVKALKRWLSGVARRAFEPQLRALAVMTGTPFNKLHIRLQRTCWGSRSSTGTISLNLCLLFLEPELTRYLMIHELCHGRHMNHSKRFWKLVSRFEEDYRALDRRLGESWRAMPAWIGIY